MGRGIYVWDYDKIYVIDALSGRLVRKSVEVTNGTQAHDPWGCVLADGRVVISSGHRVNESELAYAILDAGLTQWTDGPDLKAIDGIDPNLFVNTMFIAGNKFVGWGYRQSNSWETRDCIVQMRSLQDPTVIAVHDLFYDLSAYEGDESSPEAGAAAGDYVYYSTEGAYIHAVNVRTWALSLPINLSDDPAKYTESEGFEGTIDTDLQGSAVDETMQRVWAFSYNEDVGDPDVWNQAEVLIFSAPVGTEHHWKLEASITPPISSFPYSEYHRTFSGTGLVIHPYYYMCPESNFISRYNVTTGEMEWDWVDLVPLGVSRGARILTGSGAGGLQPITGTHQDQGVRFDPHGEPRGNRLAVRA